MGERWAGPGPGPRVRPAGPGPGPGPLAIGRNFFQKTCPEKKDMSFGNFALKKEQNTKTSDVLVAVEEQ